MALAIVISLFFGLVAAFALASCTQSIRRGLGHWHAIRAELDAMDRPAVPQVVRLRQPRESFSLLAA